jgi:hypothetical protein
LTDLYKNGIMLIMSKESDYNSSTIPFALRLSLKAGVAVTAASLLAACATPPHAAPQAKIVCELKGSQPFTFEAGPDTGNIDAAIAEVKGIADSANPEADVCYGALRKDIQDSINVAEHASGDATAFPIAGHTYNIPAQVTHHTVN